MHLSHNVLLQTLAKICMDSKPNDAVRDVCNLTVKNVMDLPVHLIKDNTWSSLRGFLANVRYLLSPVRLSVVCLSSVTLVRLTQVVGIFGNISTALGIPWSSIDIHRKFYGDGPKETPPAVELNTGGSKI